MKKFLGMVAFGVALLCCFPAMGKEYKNNLHGFSLTLPEGWQAIDSQETFREWQESQQKMGNNNRYFQGFRPQDTVVLTGPLHMDYQLHMVILVKHEEPFYVDKKSLEGFTSGVRKALEKNRAHSPDSQVISHRIRTIKGVPIIEVKATRTFWGIKVLQWNLYIPGKKRSFEVNVTLPYNKLPQEEKTLEKIIHSFQGAFKSKPAGLFGKRSATEQTTAYKIGQILGLLLLLGIVLLFLKRSSR